jgi:uncharacterized protein (TIGR00730 family)
VFCGSSSGFDATFGQAADDLGRAIAEAGAGLVYGGGDVGLMGAVATATMEAGGAVTGVITEQLHALELAHDSITTLEVAPDMHSRKARMAELADGVVVLPGGFGTCDEAFEMLTWNQLGIVSTPVTFFDVGGFYGPLFNFIDGAVRAGFMKPAHGALAQRATSAGEAVAHALSAAADFTPKWVG